MPVCALPDHLKKRKHEDWVWPFSIMPRATNAYGPRCPIGSKGYLPWPPILVKGFGVSRWEQTHPDQSIIEIPALSNIEVKGDDVYGKTWDAIERNQGFPNVGKSFKVLLTKDGPYSPSAIQEFSDHGYLVFEPKFSAKWKKLFKDKVYYYRKGARPDFVDKYYNKSLYVGLHFE